MKKWSLKPTAAVLAVIMTVAAPMSALAESNTASVIMEEVSGEEHSEESFAEEKEPAEEAPAEEEDPSEEAVAEGEDSGEGMPAEGEDSSEKALIEEEDPSEEAPAEGEDPSEEAPAEGEDPSEEVPAEGVNPSEEAPAEREDSGEEAPVEGEDPGEEVPAEGEDPSEEEPAEGETGEEVPSEEVPPQETTGVNTPEILPAETVTPEKDAELLFKETSLELIEGETAEALELLEIPDGYEEIDITWESSDVKVAEVDEEGIITAVAVGECLITAYLDTEEVSAELALTVTEKENDRIHEIIEIIDALPELDENGENAEEIEAKGQEIVALYEEILELTKKQQKEITNLSKLENLVQFLYSGISVMSLSGSCGKAVVYSISGTTLTITGVGDMEDYRSGSDVPWHDYSSQITEIVIGSGVTAIGAHAFRDLTNLTTVSMPRGIRVIGQSAFNNCTSLKSVQIPSGVQEIQDYAFYHCTELTSINISDTVTSIEIAAFKGCDSLTEITIPGSVNTMGVSAFEDCTQLSSLTFEEGVASIGTFAFANCVNLKNVVIPGSVKEVGMRAFQDCTRLTRVTLRSGVNEIGEEAFDGCITLSSVSLPNTLALIGERAFQECSRLQTISIPGSVAEIGGSAFRKSGLKSVNIPEGVTTLGSGAFMECKGLTSVTIPSSITHVGGTTFKDCSSLTSVTIKEGALEMGSYDFMNCTSLTRITIPSSITSIPRNAFYQCEKLEEIYIPESVTAIDDTAFSGCGSLVIYGKTGSYAQTFAVSKDIPFVDPAAVVPSISKIVNTVQGVHVYWNAVTGADSYILYRSSTVNGNYTRVTTLSATHYTDTGVSSGKVYYYKVRAVVGGHQTGASAAKGMTFVDTPDLTLRVNRSIGIGLGWNKIQGATGYEIYRKTTGSWVRVATIAGNSTFTWNDTAVKPNNGTVYRYTIRALAGSNMKTLSGCRNTGRTMVRLFTPTISSAAKAGATSLKATWNRNSAATGYEVRLMVGSTVYKTYTYGNNTIIAKTITGLPKGKTYKVQVRSYKKVTGVGSFYSAWSAAKNVTL